MLLPGKKLKRSGHIGLAAGDGEAFALCICVEIGEIAEGAEHEKVLQEATVNQELNDVNPTKEIRSCHIPHLCYL